MLNSSELQHIKDRVTSQLQPDKIILFGSQASGNTDKNSDVDLLILADINGNRRKLATKIDVALKGLDYARDIILLTTDEYERDKFIPGTIARYAFLEGKVIYGK